MGLQVSCSVGGSSSVVCVGWVGDRAIAVFVGGGLATVAVTPAIVA